MVYGLGIEGLGLKVHALGFGVFLGLGFKTVRLGLIVGLSQAPRGGG